MSDTGLLLIIGIASLVLTLILIALRGRDSE